MIVVRPSTRGIAGAGSTKQVVRVPWRVEIEHVAHALDVEPTRRDVATEASSVYVPSGTVAVGGTRVVQVERWTYDFGPNRFMRQVVFEDGQVVRIETLGRGSSDG